MPFVNYSRLVREVEDAIYDFEQMHPEYGLNRYSSILEANGIEWGMDSMSAKDVSVLDGKCIMAMLMGAVRAERFCDGALLGFFKKGCIKKWLERLKEIDELESVCVRRESDYLFVIRDYLVEHGMKYDETIDNKVTARKNGKTYGFSEHLQAMAYSLLSAQRPWAEIVKHLDEIDGIFFGYDAKKILEQTDTYFVDRIREIKCGNRNIHDQMKYLPDNIATLRSIEKEYGNHSVAGRISDERFTELSADYEAEQKELKEKAAILQGELSRTLEATANAEKFMKVVRKYTSFEELTPTLLREFVEKIVIHESEALDGKRRGKLRRQEIEIYYSFVGKVELPD